MRIHNFCRETSGGLTRVAATVTWEDCERPQTEISLAAEDRFGEDLVCNNSAFLLAAIMPAMRHGERRILFDGVVCPRLRNGLQTAMQQLRAWYGERGHEPVQIEASQGTQALVPRAPRRTASFMSGGVDALATLRCNRMDFPLDHPESIQDCLIVHGIDLGGYADQQQRRNSFDLAVRHLSDVAESEQVTLIPVYSTLRHLDDGDDLFAIESHGAVLSAIAHAFSPRITTALIASTDHVADLAPWGSHPLLDPNYSSCELEIRHDLLRLTRLEKVGLLADWDVALKALRSCYHPFRPDDALNCGQCEKCLRTMTELLVYNKLRACPTFPCDDVSPEQLQTLQAVPQRLNPHNGETFPQAPPVQIHLSQHWRQLLEPLQAIGRDDLAQVIKAKLNEFGRYRSRLRRRAILRRIDRKLFRGTFAKLRSSFRS